MSASPTSVTRKDGSTATFDFSNIHDRLSRRPNTFANKASSLPTKTKQMSRPVDWSQSVGFRPKDRVAHAGRLLQYLPSSLRSALQTASHCLLRARCSCDHRIGAAAEVVQCRCSTLYSGMAFVLQTATRTLAMQTLAALSAPYETLASQDTRDFQVKLNCCMQSTSIQWSWR